MAVAPRANPLDYFSPDEWRALTQRSAWRGIWLVVHAWGVIALAMAVGWLWPVTIPFAVLVIGNRQLGLAILMHDAAHSCLHANRKVNDFVAYWFCSHALRGYRPYHLQHHRYVQQTEDPDLVLSAPFPIRPASFARKALRDLTGQTFYKQRITPLVQDVLQHFRPVPGQAGSSDFSPRGLRFLVGNLLGLAVFSALGLAWVWLLMWLLPMATWLPFISRVRNIAEHALVAQNEANPLRQARTTQANWLERVLVAPYWVNYHLEHHLFTQIPCWNLPKAHALLRQRQVTPKMELEQGYLLLLRRATGVI